MSLLAIVNQSPISCPLFFDMLLTTIKCSPFESIIDWFCKKRSFRYGMAQVIIIQGLSVSRVKREGMIGVSLIGKNNYEKWVDDEPKQINKIFIIYIYIFHHHTRKQRNDCRVETFPLSLVCHHISQNTHIWKKFSQFFSEHSMQANHQSIIIMAP